MSLQLEPLNRYSYSNILRRLFNAPSIVVIGGTWKTGKSDFGLKISEDLFKLKIISECASNIDTEGKYPLIADLVSLKQWLYSTKNRKLYIFDEASEHLPNTRGMSGKSVGIKSIIPQISKAHGRMIIIGHNIKKIDSEAYDPTWCRAIIMKPQKSFTYVPAIVYSTLFPRPLKLTSISPTTIKFDPYNLAPFTEKPEGVIYFKEEDKQKLWEWANGKSGEALGLHPMQLNRLARAFIRKQLEVLT
jgi:hypothetical protein